MFVCIPPGKAVPEMTYTVLGGTLNPTHSLTVLFASALSTAQFLVVVKTFCFPTHVHVVITENCCPVVVLHAPLNKKVVSLDQGDCVGCFCASICRACCSSDVLMIFVYALSMTVASWRGGVGCSCPPAF